MTQPRGRPRRFSEYEKLIESLPQEVMRRPKYVKGIGVFRGSRGDTAWVKIRLPRGTTLGDKYYPPGSSTEMKLGRLTSWSWEQLERQRDELQGRADRGEPLKKVELPIFSDWAESWLDQNKNRLRSYSIVKIHVHKQLIPQFGASRIDQLTVGAINAWLSNRLGIVRPSTAKRELSTLSSILGAAVKAQLVPKNIVADTNAVTGITPRQRFLDTSEFAKLMSKAFSLDALLADFLLWLAHSGMRKSEVFNLRVDDVKQISGNTYAVVVRKSKTDQGRIFNCTTTMVEIFKRRSKDKPAVAALFSISRMTLRRRWEEVRQIVGIPDVNMHDLRRTHATLAAAAGVDLRTLAHRLGHSNLSMLEKHYAAVVGSASKEAANTVEEIFRLQQEPKGEQ